jgi:hypothetical protein
LRQFAAQKEQPLRQERLDSNPTESPFRAFCRANCARDPPFQRVSLIRRDAALDDGVPFHTFRGGVRSGRTGIGNVGYPFVTLAIYRSGIELRSTYSWLRALVPVWRAQYEDLSIVESVGRPDPDGSESAKAPIQARGIRFVANDGTYILFWCLKRDEVLAVLAQQPVEVDLQPRRFRWLYPGG